jgi:8-oxo-dGTP pyrophosphatase MutT (NUDIX family)
VEPDEDTWQTVLRECLEELHISAVPTTLVEQQPFFVTIARTRGQGQHTDVSLWYVLRADADAVTTYDHEEFAAIRWLTPEQVLGTPADTLDPNMHRFTAKLLATAPSFGPVSPPGPPSPPEPLSPSEPRLD